MEGARDRRPDALGSLQYLPDEELCRIVSFLAPKDVGSLACVSSIFYVICNEEPLWMDLCMENHSGLIAYKGSWKVTTLEMLGLVKNLATLYNKAPLHFDGFSSLFLYRRWYRCHVVLEGFVAPEAIERREKVTPEEFSLVYDGKRPVVLTDLTEEWPAKVSWSMDQLVDKYGDIAFKVGQSHGKKVMMKLKDYATYMAQQHDEEPLYVFDPKFGKYAPALLEDYKVPSLFSEDLLGLLDEGRPPFRWLVIGPCRSGASWHVDPALTSAWNTLLCGHKRWALYPPGRVPPAVTVHVDEDDGDIDFDGPTSLQWWMDVYPSLKDEDKPVEYVQHPGETIFVPSGWWHCILNIDTTVAVTQNFVNKTNLELVCLDMAPGYRHRGIARAGNIALSEVSIIHKGGLAGSDGPATELETASADCKPGAPGFVSLAPSPTGRDANGRGVTSTFTGRGISDADAQLHYSSFVDFNILSSHIEEHPDHFNSKSSSGYLGPRLLRLWLCKLWTARPDLQPLIWKSACRVLDSDTWLQRVTSICEAYGFPGPDGVEQLPVGNGSNPVFLVGDKVIKFYVEDGLQGSVNVLGSELEFYALIRQSKSQLEKHIPALIGSGIIYPDGEKFKAVHWDGVGEIPPAEGQETTLIKKRTREREKQDQRIRTKWFRFAERAGDEQEGVGKKALFCPYIIMERCMGKNLSEVRKDLTSGDMMEVASFLGQQVRNLHSVPLPDGLLEKDNGSFVGEAMCTHVKESRHGDGSSLERNPVATTLVRNIDERVKPGGKWTCTVPWEWQSFVRFLREKREQITDSLYEWEMIPEHLTKQVDFYLPKDPATVIDFLRIEGDRATPVRPPVWIHMDIMLDNVQMAPNLEAEDGESVGGQARASHIIDLGDLNLGDPLYDFIAIYLDIFRGDVPSMQRFLQEYDLPVWAGSECGPRVSYKAMCYVLLYRLRAGKVLFQVKEALRSVETWEEVEEQVFGFLNDWQQQQTCGERGGGHGIHRQQR